MYALGVLINSSFSFNQLNLVALRLGFSVEFGIPKTFLESSLKLGALTTTKSGNSLITVPNY
jgi:hypothetical protein